MYEMQTDVRVPLREEESAALAVAAADRGMSPERFARAVLMAHIDRKPQWSRVELEALRDFGEATRQVAILMRSMSDPDAVKVGAALEATLNHGLAACVMENVAYWDGASPTGPEPVRSGVAP